MSLGVRLQAAALIAVAITIGLLTTGCARKKLTKAEFRTALQEIAAFNRVWEELSTDDSKSAEEMLAAAEQFNATNPLSQAMKKMYIDSAKSEVISERMFSTVFAPFEHEEWWSRHHEFGPAIEAAKGWEAESIRYRDDFKRVFGAYLDEVTALLPNESSDALREQAKQVEQFADEYYSFLMNECGLFKDSTVEVFKFLVANRNGMRTSVEGAYWNSNSLNEEYVRLVTVMSGRATQFEARYAKVMALRAEIVGKADSNIQNALRLLAE